MKATQKEFEVLDSMFAFGAYKKELSYPHLNIYTDVAPFAETAVVIGFDKSMT